LRSSGDVHVEGGEEGGFGEIVLEMKKRGEGKRWVS